VSILDIKISGADTENDLAVFEQTGLTPNGGPPLHIHPYQDEWFYVIANEIRRYYFSTKKGKNGHLKDSFKRSATTQN
jgi:hypothetical protein